jgi:YHS domain-containing protein
MTVVPATAAGSHPFAGRTYYFCLHLVSRRVREAPQRFLDKQTVGRARNHCGVASGRVAWLAGTQTATQRGAGCHQRARCAGCSTGAEKRGQRGGGVVSPPSAGPATKEIDPVCGMTVDPASAAGSHPFAGKTWYFCSYALFEQIQGQSCGVHGQAGSRDRLRRTVMYNAPLKSAGRSSDRASIYTCPMHPEIRQEGPGACPKMRNGA